MRLLVEYGAHEKVFLGSDFPAATTSQTIEGLRNINQLADKASLPSIPNEIIESIIESIIYRDTLGILGLQVSKTKGTK